MRKSKLVFVIAALLLLSVVIAGCTVQGNGGYSIELNKTDCAAIYNEAEGVYEFLQDEVNLELFKLLVYDGEGNMIDKDVKVTESMISSSDLDKLKEPGTNTITVVYQNAKLRISIKVIPKKQVRYYTISFNAGQNGYFEGKANIEYTDPNGNTILNRVYENGIIDVLELPTRPGYDFDGWYLTEDYSGSKIVAGKDKTITRNTTFYAKWSDQRKYSVEYNCYLEGTFDTQLEKATGVEHGSEIALKVPPEKLGYIFTDYTIITKDAVTGEEVTTTILADEESPAITVVSDTRVKFNYKTKYIKLTYVSDYWQEGDTIYGIDLVYKENVAKLNNEDVSGWCYIVEVPYNTELREDENPIPVFPDVESSTGYWLNTNTVTGSRPVYGAATEDMVVVAYYQIKRFSFLFYEDEKFEVPYRDNAGNQIKSTADYGQKVDKQSLPKEPERTGHSSAWYILDGTSLVKVDLWTIELTQDIKVCVRYTPNEYEIRFYYRPTETSEYTYDSVIYPYGSIISAPSLTDYYSEKYYAAQWYSNRTFDTLIEHTNIMVTKDESYYFNPAKNKYKVHFAIQRYLNDDDIYFEVLDMYEYLVEPDSSIVPPEINFDESSPLFGQRIIGWRTLNNIMPYDENTIYSAGDIVLYNNKFFKCIWDGAQGYEPQIGSYWRDAQQEAWILRTNIGANGIQIKDFHEYNENLLYDRAFYAVLEPKEYNVKFMNMGVGGSAAIGYNNEFYQVDSRTMEHGNHIIDGVDTIEDGLTKPVYPDGATDMFVFDGWYIDRNFTTMRIDFSQEYYVKEDIVFYAKWTDKLKGTDGLEYELVDESYYKITGFRPNIPEYSYIELRIPALYNGLPVKEIAAGAFNDFGKILYITSVALGANLETIGDNAFASLSALESFILEENPRFVYENGLLYSADRTILYRVVPTHTGDTFNFPDTIVRVTGGAFAYCKQLTTLNANDSASLTTIGAYAFAGCSGLRTVYIPESVVEIGDYAFRGCYNISSLTGGLGLERVGMGVFNSVLDILTVKHDGEDSYLTFGNILVKYTGSKENVTLESSIVGIAAGAFADHDELITFSVTSSSALRYIGERAFYGSFALNEITFECDHKIDADESAFEKISLTCVLYVNENMVDAYRADEAYRIAFTEEDLILHK